MDTQIKSNSPDQEKKIHYCYDKKQYWQYEINLSNNRRCTLWGNEDYNYYEERECNHEHLINGVTIQSLLGEADMDDTPEECKSISEWLEAYDMMDSKCCPICSTRFDKLQKVQTICWKMIYCSVWIMKSLIQNPKCPRWRTGIDPSCLWINNNEYGFLTSKNMNKIMSSGQSKILKEESKEDNEANSQSSDDAEYEFWITWRQCVSHGTKDSYHFNHEFRSWNDEYTDVAEEAKKQLESIKKMQNKFKSDRKNLHVILSINHILKSKEMSSLEQGYQTVYNKMLLDNYNIFWPLFEEIEKMLKLYKIRYKKINHFLSSKDVHLIPEMDETFEELKEYSNRNEIFNTQLTKNYEENDILKVEDILDFKLQKKKEDSKYEAWDESQTITGLIAEIDESSPDHATFKLDSDFDEEIVLFIMNRNISKSHQNPEGISWVKQVVLTRNENKYILEIDPQKDEEHTIVIKKPSNYSIWITVFFIKLWNSAREITDVIISKFKDSECSVFKSDGVRKENTSKSTSIFGSPIIDNPKSMAKTYKQKHSTNMPKATPEICSNLFSSNSKSLFGNNGNPGLLFGSKPKSNFTRVTKYRE